MGVAVLWWALAAATSPAGPAPPPPENPDTIIVTGERAKRAVKDTPSSVRVVTTRELQAMPADRLEQVLAGIPNVQLGEGSEGPAIRGQNSTGVLNSLPAFLGGARPRATLEVDGRAVGFQEFVFGNAPLWDVQQIEVFRSPLTVTHGRNSIGGGIVMTTHDPTANWEGAARVILGDFSTREASALISGPVVANELAFRVAGDIRHARTTVRLAELMRGANPNDDKYSLLRFKLLGEPTALPGLKVVGTITHSYSQAPQNMPILRPFEHREFPFGGYGIFGVHVNAGTLHATQQLRNGQFEAIASLGDTHTRRYAEPGLGEAHADLTDLSGEMFGDWKPADAVTLRGGFHGLNSQFRQHIDLTNFMGSIGNFRDHQKSLGGFGEVEVAVTKRLSVSAGARYQDDRQLRRGGLVGVVTAPIEFDARFSAILPKAAASYALTPRLKAGVLVQRAYNPGGATLDFDTGGLDAFEAEHLWDYEAFVKGGLPGGKVWIQANLFYNDISDAQRGVAVPITRPDGRRDFLFKFNNVPKASTHGAELELNWSASRALTLSGGIGLLRTMMASNRNNDGDLIGAQFARSPRLTASAAADWLATQRLRLSAQARYHSSYFSDDFDSPQGRVGRAMIVDARASYTMRNLTLFAYARNVFDSFHVNFWLDRDVAEADDPRMIGFGIEAH
jgi:outer membrane receptor protein involved in Fe transport